MGLSTKQVSGDHGADWGQSLLQSGSLELPKPPTVRRQQPQQPPEPVACPRCSSTNTKFCYYNNYNKSQPRHYCKACKRHWTKGGTLRNVPVGGGRKNKRLKTSANTTTTSAATTTTVKRDTHMGDQSQEFSQEFYQTPGVQKNIPQALYEINPPGVCQNDSETSFSGNDSDFLGSFLENQTQPFTFSSLSSFENNPCFRSFDCFNFTTEGLGSSMDETTITTTTTTVGSDQPWQVPATINSLMEPASYWNWEDIEPLVMSNELSSPDWDDSTETKPQF